jgi:H+/Cl- antiporter ClcA
VEVSETYGDEARIQLNFFSFMTIAIWICFGAAFTFAITFHFVVSSTTVVGNANIMFWFATMMYGFIGFIFSLVGAAIVYHPYKYWCEKMRGQRIRGKIALINRDL